MVVGISVGSEDLYRVSPTGIAANSGYGASPETLARYVGQLRQAIAGGPLAGKPVGHVDTWTAYVNGSNKAIIDAVDFIGVNAFPYFENTLSNGVQSGAELYESALSQTRAFSQGKELWLTETGWPVSGPTENLAVPSTQNAKAFWDAVGCPRFGKVNMYWYTLQDATPTTPSPSFGIVGSDGQAPLFDLSCNAASTTSAASSSASATSSAAATTAASSVASDASSAISSAVSSAVSSATQVASSASSVASSIASNPPASSGGGLSPSQGGQVGALPSTLTQSTGPAPTNATGPASTTMTGTGGASATVVQPTATPPVTVPQGSASRFSASTVGAFVAIFAAVMAL